MLAPRAFDRACPLPTPYTATAMAPAMLPVDGSLLLEWTVSVAWIDTCEVLSSVAADCCVLALLWAEYELVRFYWPCR